MSETAGLVTSAAATVAELWGTVSTLLYYYYYYEDTKAFRLSG